ncbi:MAG: Hsp20/alpha crystallin family protein [Clostridiales bacterium]|nr:Hsp20/alpha crystallin family protein [Clostridiales bacterium]
MYNNMVPFGHNRLFDLFDNFDQELLPTMTGSFRTDILDQGEAYVLQAELPGFHKEDIKVELKEGVLTIEAKRAEQSEEEKEGYVRRERRTGTFSRRFNVTGIQENAISAKFHDGILELTLPKVQPEVPEVQQITIE